MLDQKLRTLVSFCQKIKKDKIKPNPARPLLSVLFAFLIFSAFFVHFKWYGRECVISCCTMLLDVPDVMLGGLLCYPDGVPLYNPLSVQSNGNACTKTQKNIYKVFSITQISIWKPFKYVKKKKKLIKHLFHMGKEENTSERFNTDCSFYYRQQ